MCFDNDGEEARFNKTKRKEGGKMRAPLAAVLALFVGELDDRLHRQGNIYPMKG